MRDDEETVNRWGLSGPKKALSMPPCKPPRKMAYLGVDPGGSGAMGLVDEDGHYVSHIKLKETERDVYEWLREYKRVIKYAVLEKVHSRPGQGVKSVFKFGTSYGFCRGLLVASGVRFEVSTPQKWMKAMKCMTKGDKNVTKAAAQCLWPNVKIIHANADALLIAEYGRRLMKGLFV